jgi:hypothetical protein
VLLWTAFTAVFFLAVGIALCVRACRHAQSSNLSWVEAPQNASNSPNVSNPHLHILAKCALHDGARRPALHKSLCTCSLSSWCSQIPSPTCQAQ